MTISRERVEQIAAAVDEITDRDGLNCGEALYAFTFMIIGTLAVTSPDVRAMMARAVTDSIQVGDTAPLAKLITGRKTS